MASGRSSLDQVLLALADPARRRVVEALQEGPRRAGELAQHVGMKPPALSRHLRHLRRAGVIEEQPMVEDARVRIFRLCPRPFAQLRTWAEEVESYWQRQLAGFKAHAERSRSPPR